MKPRNKRGYWQLIVFLAVAGLLTAFVGSAIEAMENVRNPMVWRMVRTIGGSIMLVACISTLVAIYANKYRPEHKREYLLRDDTIHFGPIRRDQCLVLENCELPKGTSAKRHAQIIALYLPAIEVPQESLAKLLRQFPRLELLDLQKVTFAAGSSLRNVTEDCIDLLADLKILAVPHTLDSKEVSELAISLPLVRLVRGPLVYKVFVNQTPAEMDFDSQSAPGASAAQSNTIGETSA